MKTPFLSLLTAALLTGCGAGIDVSVVVGGHHHWDWDNEPLTLAQISACPNTHNGYWSHVHGCMTGRATGQVRYSHQVCSLVIAESGRITLGIAGSDYFESFDLYPDDASYTKWPGATLDSFELIASNHHRPFVLQAVWPGAVLPSGASVTTLAVSIGALACDFVL